MHRDLSRASCTGTKTRLHWCGCNSLAVSSTHVERSSPESDCETRTRVKGKELPLKAPGNPSRRKASVRAVECPAGAVSGVEAVYKWREMQRRPTPEGETFPVWTNLREGCVRVFAGSYERLTLTLRFVTLLLNLLLLSATSQAEFSDDQLSHFRRGK